MRTDGLFDPVEVLEEFGDLNGDPPLGRTTQCYIGLTGFYHPCNHGRSNWVHALGYTLPMASNHVFDRVPAKGVTERHDSGTSYSSRGEGLSPTRSRLTTSSSVETSWGEPSRTGQGVCVILASGNVCLASSRRRRWRSSANGLGVAGSVGLGINLATGRKLRLGVASVASVRRRATGGVEQVNYQRLGEEPGLTYTFGILQQ